MTDSNALLNDPKRVSVIGLGNMGSALAGALISAGHQVTVWNRTPGKCDPLVKQGASAAGSVAEAAGAADIVIVCVADHAATEQVLHNAEVGQALNSGLLVQLTSLTAEQSQATATWAEAQGAGYLEGSILSYPHDVTEGTATIVYAGPRDVFDGNKAVLRALGGAPRFVGDEVGAAKNFGKLSYVFSCGIMHAFMQGAAMAHVANVSIEGYGETMVARLPAFAETLKMLGEMIAKRDHDDVKASMNVHAAVLADALDLCKDLGVNDVLPVAMMSNFERAIAAGHGEREISALFEVLIGTGSGEAP